MATLADTAIVLKRLAAAYGQTITADQARAYQAVIGTWPRMDLAGAAVELMGESTFLPRPAELRAALAARKTRGLSWTGCKMAADERCLWKMFELGVNSIDELSEAQIGDIYSEQMSLEGVPA